ncbi:MAG: RNA-binding protein [Bacteroidetes bacterium GWC2_33_15]|nr:MAG: RNA-binding protein [Bacteroidetes bacterium GWA2_33_15]OFX51097.1 MAG: RNA-binding protein [Bacteroidetes bacterium GWC2_33_15]OFX66470.1 MAG: RNA-binding protein [Bacteroidetes bacterium GWB2_32_14]OFX70305.1 MAG: RNA-binding protein [Bacteroidetes bacterium GWD2_33_33]HAN17305.1 RNA-binding protein [Bacteroidales bacterium]
MINFKLNSELDYIELIKLLKVTNMCMSGGEAKQLVDDGIVKLNGQIESRKRAKIRKGDKVEIFDKTIVVE